MKFLWLKVSIIVGRCYLWWGLFDLIGLRHASSLKKSLGNLLEAAEDDILLVLDARYSVSRVWCLFSCWLGLYLGTDGFLLLLNLCRRVGDALLKIQSSLILFFVTSIGISACINYYYIILCSFCSQKRTLFIFPPAPWLYYSKYCRYYLSEIL